MSLEDRIRSILFQIGKDVVLHRVDSSNIIIDIDYEKYVEELASLLRS
jgi:hypothetical protein